MSLIEEYVWSWEYQEYILVRRYWKSDASDAADQSQGNDQDERK